MADFTPEFSTRIFTLASRREGTARFYRIECPDWINVIPLTPAGEVVFVRQFRHGIGAETLEVPGGQMDPGDPSPLEAARRELLEETGYAADDWAPLGWVHPNPALITNRCHSFVVRGVRPVAPIRNDADERTEVELAPLAAVPELIRSGRITHGLVLNAFHWLLLAEEGLKAGKSHHACR
jgi:8-oxo-dGTP pyrophosphatase MutT (NUDIX family)